MIFKSLSVSLINYGIELYGRHKNKWIDQLQKTQNRLIKILTKEHFRTNTNSLYKKYDIIKIHDQAKLRLSLINHRVVYAKESLNCSHRSLQLNNDIHNRNLRNNLNFQTNVNSYDKKNKFVESASVVWNNLNNDLKNTKSRSIFKENFSKELINTY